MLAAGAAAWMESPDPAAGNGRDGVGNRRASTFYLNYFREFATTGGRSHLTHITAPVEPKAQALQQILSASPDKTTAVIAQQWWLVWPMAYLATDTRTSPSPPIWRRHAWFAETLHRGRLFSSSSQARQVLADRRALARARGWRNTTTMIRDAGGRIGRWCCR